MNQALEGGASRFFLARPAREELVKEGLNAEAVAKRLMMPKSALAKHNGRHNGYEVSIGQR